MSIIQSSFSSINNSLCWADSVPDLQIASIASVSVSVQIDGVVILSTMLATYAGTASMELAEMIQEECRLKNLSMPQLTVTATANGTTETVRCRLLLRSRRFAGSAEDFAATRFLTLSPYYSAGADGFTVGYLRLPGELEQISLRTWYETPDGEVADTGDHIQTVSGSETVYNIRRYTLRHRLPAGCRPLTSVVTQGERKARIIWNPEATDRFSFINPLGQTESFFTRATVSRKLTTKASVSVIGRMLSRYDTERSTEFTANFGPSDPARAETVAWLAESENTSWQTRGDYGTWGDATAIIVTDCTTEISPDPDQLAEPTLTFRTRDPMAPSALPPKLRLHTSQFSDQFD